MQKDRKSLAVGYTASLNACGADVKPDPSATSVVMVGGHPVLKQDSHSFRYGRVKLFSLLCRLVAFPMLIVLFLCCVGFLGCGETSEMVADVIAPMDTMEPPPVDVIAPMDTTEPPPASDESLVVDVPDASLRASIAEALSITDGMPITPENMLQLTELDLSLEGISALTGLEHAINLEVLNFADNRIVDISPLSGLTNLKVLFLAGNRIVDISPLSGLTNLEMLNLDDNDIVDISPLSGLTNLKVLFLAGNRIVDISPLLQLTDLEALNLLNNPLSEISKTQFIPIIEANGTEIGF